MSPAAQILAAIDARPGTYLVAIAGVPGSGKSTVCEQILAQRPAYGVVPMDGYHIPRCQLNDEGRRRRGAPHTFDDASFRRDLTRLRETRAGRFPRFDHAVKDPEPDAIIITPETPVVLVEGLYLLLRDWRLEPLFDLKVLLTCDAALAVERLWPRHLDAEIEPTPEAARHRAETSDAANAALILDDGCADRADLVIATDVPASTDP